MTDSALGAPWLEPVFFLWREPQPTHKEARKEKRALTHRWLIGTVGVLALAAALALTAAGGAPASLAVDGIIYVDADADPGGDGKSWETAFTELQPAIDAASAGVEIWVAAGTYKPTSGDDRTISFSMKNEVAIYGGFAGGETTLEERDWGENATILSGDLNGDDGEEFANREDNSYHVFYHNSDLYLDSTAVLDGFIIIGGNATGTDPNHSGGGMYNNSASPTLANCSFQSNAALANGGGIYNWESSPELTNCTFTYNSASNGGGIHNSEYSAPTLSDCFFGSNSADFGGGMHNDYSSPAVANCNFEGNVANVDGAGVYNRYNSSPELTNCSFSYNWASNYGGGMANWSYSSPVLLNVTFTGNSADGSGGGIYNYDYSSPALTNCTFSGNGTNAGGGGMSSQGYSSPTLTNVTFTGNTASAGGGGMSIGSSSSSALTNCILWGNTPDQIVDTGGASVVNYCDIEGGYTGGTGNIDADPLFVDAIGGDLRLEFDSPAIDAGDNDAPGLADVTTDLDGNPRFADVDSVLDTGNGTAPIVDMGAYETPSEVILVDRDATGANNGQSWQDALTDLEDALDWAMEGIEIWVAEGTYKPSVAYDGTGERYKSFQMINGVAIYGGFAGTETERGQRDWANNETILSGDIGNEGDPADNSYHVFYHPAGTDLDATAILDGFTITGGNANGDETLSDMGGGMFNWVSSPALSNCRFEGNSARSTGGGMANENGSSPALSNCTFYDNFAPSGGGMENWYYSSPVLINVTFSGNSAGSGGGMRNRSYSSPVLTDCTFEGNSADVGGGMYNYQDSSPTLTGCAFVGNSASRGGGMANSDSSAPVLTDCIFSGNWAGSSGGGMSNQSSSSPTLTNCTFTGNSATIWGGGMVNWASSPSVLTNCTFSGNSASTGGAMYNFDSSPVLTNCVLWGDTPDEIYDLGSSAPDVTYSDVQDGGYVSDGNIDEDPLFLDAVNGDFHLLPRSPCIDAGTNDAPNLPDTDFEGDPRSLDGDRDGTATVDMGVDEALWHPVYLPLVLRGY